ncbi:uncharacterized protein TNCV_1298561 [Trichonephila clavipes]|nr:uncharacterized protein TNCV_1298561 [Trichonephila clavipes]
MKQITSAMEVSERWMRWIEKPELGPKPYKLRTVLLLTEKTNSYGCRKLLRRDASQHWKRFLFTHENFFTVQQIHSSQNDRIWSMDASSDSAIVEHSQYSKSVIL